MVSTLVPVGERARLSLGASADVIYATAAASIAARHPGGGTLLDVGCGRGDFRRYVGGRFAHYLGSDVVRHPGFPDDEEFLEVDLDSGRVPLPDASADVVAAIETIEHLENPRAFMRELCRLVKPGGWVVATTPNQLSLLSKLSFLLRNEFPAFRGRNYPAHLTALLEVDLRLIAAECGLVDIAVEYTGRGRVPATPWHWPAPLAKMRPRIFSDNVLLVGRAEQ